MKTRFQSGRLHRNEQGYILLTLLLFVTILIITMAVVVPEVTFQVKRDREEEMIHRGVQYSRAIRAYVKKFGRYPTRVEDLENTNNIRFLRRRYKDPITGKDFKLLHVGEVQLMPGSGLAGATPVSAMPGALGQQPQQSLNQPTQGQPTKSDENQDQQNGNSSDQPKGATNSRRQRSLFPGIRRRPHRRRRQYQQSGDHPRVQSQEPLQPVAVYLRPIVGPRRTVEHPRATAAARRDSGCRSTDARYAIPATGPAAAAIGASGEPTATHYRSTAPTIANTKAHRERWAFSIPDANRVTR